MGEDQDGETLGSVWTFLDITPFGRQETWKDPPEGYPQSPPYKWWRKHDEYGRYERLRPLGQPATAAVASISMRKSGCINAWTPTQVEAGGSTPAKNSATRGAICAAASRSRPTT